MVKSLYVREHPHIASQAWQEAVQDLSQLKQSLWRLLVFWVLRM